MIFNARLAREEGLTADQSLAGAHRPNVGAGLLAKVVNDDAFQQDKRRAFKTFASKPAPTFELRRAQNLRSLKINVGAGLLAKL
ncbi:hypothetical protein [Pseudomonas sp. NPDC086251]|uniref:hypothetical protein n=1 Tax=Pseudomonas sp. NPDC086251 TaxID=3364431 RepID=UPI003838AA41